jgi:F-type H+-transporting ATPase subunit a
MTTHEALLTQFFNTYLAGLGNMLLALFGQKTADEPWADHMVMQLLVALIMIVLFLVLRSRLSVDKPGKLQQIFELIHGFVTEQADDQIEHHQGRKHVVLFETLFIFILLGNLVGVIPQFVSPTQCVYVPAGCALIAFLYYNIVGIKKNGLLKYSKHFLGPIPVMAPIMIPIELISHMARPLSLTIRLFANMYAGEKVTLLFLSMTYLIGPAIFMGLHVFVSLLQAYIFVLLTMLYVAGAVAEEH